MESRRFYVYAHRRRDTGAIAYIGKGTRRRAWAISGRNGLWTKIHLKHGFDVEIVHSDLTEDDAFRLEKIEIAAHQPACNFTKGGEGITGHRHSPETREAIRSAHKGKRHSPEVIARRAESLRGKGRSPEFCEAVSARMTGFRHSPDTRERMRIAHLGKKQSPEAIAKTASSHRGAKRSSDARRRMSEAQPRRAVICITTGNEFASITSAAEWLRENGRAKATKTGVWRALKDQGSAYGFRWAYTCDAQP